MSRIRVVTAAVLSVLLAGAAAPSVVTDPGPGVGADAVSLSAGLDDPQFLDSLATSAFAESSPTGGAGAWAAVSPAGDLDRDGFDDLSVWHAGERRSMILSGRDGQPIAAPRGPLDAAVAWTAVAQDLGGSSQPDFVRVAITNLHTERQCETAGSCEEHATWTWVVSAHPTLQAPALWSWSQTAELDAVDNSETIQGEFRHDRTWQGLNDRLEVRVVPAGARGHMLATVLSTDGRVRDGVGPAGLRVWPTIKTLHEQTVKSTSMTALDGAGNAVATHTLEVHETREHYQFPGDLDGDGLGELVLTVEGEDRASGTRDVFGANLAKLWSTHPFGRMLNASNDEHGRSRVALTAPGWTQMLDGASGRVLWESTTPVAAGRNIHGDFSVMAFYLIADGEHGDDAQGTVNWTAQINRVNLDTGEVGDVIGMVDVGTLSASAWPGSFSGFDVDGDGRLDLVGQTYEQGVDGGRLLSISQAGDSKVGPVTIGATPWIGMQLDSAPGVEVLWRTWSDFDGAWTGVQASRPGQRMWSMSRERFDSLVPVTGDGVTHFSLVEVADDGDAVVRLYDGGTMDPRWTVRLT